MTAWMAGHAPLRAHVMRWIRVNCAQAPRSLVSVAASLRCLAATAVLWCTAVANTTRGGGVAVDCLNAGGVVSVFGDSLSGLSAHSS